MDQELLGYLLDALDPETTAEVERHLETSPEGRSRLMALRKALHPLTHDNEQPEPPPNLVFNTLKRVAEHECRTEPPRILTLPTERAAAGGRSTWRRPDVLIAASIVGLGLLLVPPALLQLQHTQARQACKNNLLHLYQNLQTFATDHDNKLPGPEAEPPLNHAGMMMVRLNDDHLLDSRKLVNCPANGVTNPPYVPTSAELKEQYGKPGFDDMVRKMGGCYAYHMGYQDDDHHLRPVSFEDDKLTPIVADRPLRREEGVGWNVDNSPNHGRWGQNVLHLGGHVEFLKSRLIDRDDIYLTNDRRVHAGRSLRDHVLGPSEATPLGE